MQSLVSVGWSRRATLAAGWSRGVRALGMSLAVLLASLQPIASALAREAHGHWIAGCRAPSGQTFTSPEAACINAWQATGSFSSTSSSYGLLEARDFRVTIW